MRTDVKVNQRGLTRCPEIPIASPGRPSSVTRGDWIEWGDGFRGRIIGTVVDPDDRKQYLVVVMQMLDGCCCERWVLPEHVTNTAHGNAGSQRDMYHDKASWLFGEQFFTTKPDAARQCFELTVDHMAKY